MYMKLYFMCGRLKGAALCTPVVPTKWQSDPFGSCNVSLRAAKDLT
jgi:hypothetical protein